jgi:hypothetical protein
LVQQVHRAAEGYRFDATVARWQGYLLAGFVLLCLVVAGLFVRQNVLFVSAYLARLFQPFSQVQPVSATALDSTSGDVVTSPDSPVTLTAAVRGRLPESAVLVVTRREPNDANESAPSAIERTEARVVRDDGGNARHQKHHGADHPTSQRRRPAGPALRAAGHRAHAGGPARQPRRA